MVSFCVVRSREERSIMKKMLFLLMPSAAVIVVVLKKIVGEKMRIEISHFSVHFRVPRVGMIGRC